MERKHKESSFEIESLDDVPKWYGITGPMNLNSPSEAELKQTQQLTCFLNSLDISETSEELQHREKVVKSLETLYKDWLTDICIEMDLPQSVTEQVGGRLLPFGSYQLGVHTKKSDIDILCVGPGFIERQVFFTSFPEKLKAQKEVKDIQVIEEAYVPVINLSYDGIEIDVVYAKVMRKSISDKLNLLDSTLLQEMDKHSARSLNGYRVSEEILRLVPNVYNFRRALTVIKHWAKCRNIYSNKLGFLGGVSWCILVARICQLYPYVSASLLVTKFFLIYSIWEWRIPVMLRHPERCNYNLPTWDPYVNPSDSFHHMQIITPAYPQQNSAFNVSSSTLTVMMDEIKRGRCITEAIQDRRARWRKLFEPSNFFQKYRNYIVLRATSATELQHQEWVGLVESKIRLLVGILERNPSIALAQANIQSFPLKKKDGQSTIWLIGLFLNKNAPKTLNLTPDLLSFSQTVYSLAERMYKEGMGISATYVRQKGLRALLPDVKLPVLVKPRPSVKNTVEVKKRACSPSEEACSKKLRCSLETTPETDTLHKSVTSSPLSDTPCEKSSSTKRPCTEPDYAAKRFKQEDNLSPVKLFEPASVHTKPMAVKRNPIKLQLLRKHN